MYEIFYEITLGLTIISGRRNIEPLTMEEGRAYYVPLLACSKVVERDVDKELDQMLKVECWCIQDDENYRPSMGQVVHVLEDNTEVNAPPVPRFLQDFALVNN